MGEDIRGKKWGWGGHYSFRNIEIFVVIDPIINLREYGKCP